MGPERYKSQRGYKCKVFQHHIAVQESLSLIEEHPLLLGKVNGHVLKGHAALRGVPQRRRRHRSLWSEQGPTVRATKGRGQGVSQAEAATHLAVPQARCDPSWRRVALLASVSPVQNAHGAWGAGSGGAESAQLRRVPPLQGVTAGAKARRGSRPHCPPRGPGKPARQLHGRSPPAPPPTRAPQLLGIQPPRWEMT